MITDTLTWPIKQPDSVLDYGLNIACLQTDETVLAVSGSASPSGSGEMTAQSISYAANEVIMWLAGGVAGRRYFVKIEVVTSASRTYEWLIAVQIDPELADFPLPKPPSTDFSTPVTWST